MNLKTEILGAIVLVVVIVGLVLWYMSEHPAPYINSGATGTTTSGQVGGKDGPPATLNESAKYYDIKAQYPSSTSLRTSAGAGADAKAVTAMKGFEQNTIDAFKEQGNFANLSAEDIKMLGFDQGRKESLGITYNVKRGTHTVSYIYTIYEDTMGAHPNAYYRTFTFDTKTGGGLTIDDLFAPGVHYNDLLSTATRKALPSIVAAREGVSLSAVDSDMIASGTMAEADSFQNWYIDGTDFVIIFPPYQVAPYAAGEIEVRLPFASLSSSLSSAYK